MSWALVVVEDHRFASGVIGPFESELAADTYAEMLDFGEEFSFESFEMEEPSLTAH